LRKRKQTMNLTGKTLLITGIGNFIGLRTTEMALERGIKVRGIEPSAAAAQAAEQRGATVTIGSTVDPVALAIACENVDIVFHTESITQPSGDLEHFRAVNVGGTINAATAAKQAGVQALVHLSSALVYGFKYPDRITETGRLQGDNNPFCQTKIESETEVLKFNDPPEFGVAILRAGDIYGPGADAWVARPLELMQKNAFALVDGGRGIMNHLYIDNLVDGLFLALEQEAFGEAFNLTDGYETTWKEFYYRLAEIGGMPKPISMPAFLVKQAAQLKQKDANVSPAAVDFIMRPHAYSIEKAQQQLQFTPRVGLDEGMAQTAAWLRSRSLSNAVLT
jgi:nucleoside-diphosphate-sugar epimerase